MPVEHEELRGFEQVLDAALDARKFRNMDPVRAIENCAGAISTAYSQSWHEPGRRFESVGQRLSLGFEIALPILVGSNVAVDSDPTQEDLHELIIDLEFMSHYYLLRDYLYYSYNAANSFEWSFTDDAVRITFSDPSIPRQFAQSSNAAILDSLDDYEFSSRNSDRILQLLNGVQEGGQGDHIQECFPLIELEAEKRIAKHFNFLGKSSTEVEFDQYTYSEFYKISHYLVAKALYHRYYARANTTWATFKFPQSDLIEEIHYNTQLPRKKVRRILGELTYSRPDRRLQPMYFPLIKHAKSDEYIMIPERVLRTDWLVQFLRVHALKSPNHFLSNVSDSLGNGLVRHIAETAQQYGYFARTNVMLNHIERSAPDIDVFLMAREPTLGYCVFLCEVKAPLPARWAKDYLRVLEKDSILKAFGQVDRILDVLNTPDGIRFLGQLIKSIDPEPLDDAVVLVRKLIVTSQNSGMFFEEPGKNTQILDYRTFLRVIERSDGDTAYLLQILHKLPTMFTPKVVKVSTSIGHLSVTYDAATWDEPKIIARTTWKSDGTDKVVIENFFAEGGSRREWIEKLDREGRFRSVTEW